MEQVKPIDVANELKYILIEETGLYHEMKIIHDERYKYTAVSSKGYELGYVEISICSETKEIRLFGVTSGCWSFIYPATRLSNAIVSKIEQQFKLQWRITGRL